MHVVIIKNIKQKAVSVILLLCLWATMITITDFMSSNPTLLNVSLNDNINFSYPMNMIIENIFVNEKIGNSGVKTVSLFSTPPVEMLKSFDAKGLGLSFSFPSAFQMTEQSFLGNEILYHVDFNNKSKEVYGFIQVWNLETPLKDFLINSKKTALSTFLNFKMSEIKVNNLDGYLWDYIAVNDGKSIKALEAFLQKDGKMYRVSYFVPEKFFNKEQEKTFMNILNSIKVD